MADQPKWTDPQRQVALATSLPEGRQDTCPFCGLMVIFEDAALTVHHQAPPCERFEAMVKEAGSTHRVETRIYLK